MLPSFGRTMQHDHATKEPPYRRTVAKCQSNGSSNNKQQTWRTNENSLQTLGKSNYRNSPFIGSSSTTWHYLLRRFRAQCYVLSGNFDVVFILAMKSDSNLDNSLDYWKPAATKREYLLRIVAIVQCDPQPKRDIIFNGIAQRLPTTNTITSLDAASFSCITRRCKHLFQTGDPKPLVVGITNSSSLFISSLKPIVLFF